MDNKLIEAYQTTTYFVHPLGKKIGIRIGNLHPDLDSFLVLHNAQEWAFITAYNPGSKILSETENEKNQKDLEKMISNARYIFFQGEGIGADSLWPPEKSILALGISQKVAEDFAQQFGQNAIVFGEIGKKAELLLIKPKKNI